MIVNEEVKKTNPYGLKPGEEVIMTVRKGAQGALPPRMDSFDYIQQRTALDEKGRRVGNNMVVIIGRVF